MAIDLFQADEIVSRTNVNQRLTDVKDKFTSVDTIINTLTPVYLYYNDPGTTGTITLSQSIANFQIIEVYYWMISISSTWNGSAKFHNGGVGSINTSITINIPASFNGTPRLKAYGSSVIIADDSLTRNKSVLANITGTNTSAVGDTSSPETPSIYAVVGYKY
jgi:hypothetical protein